MQNRIDRLEGLVLSLMTNGAQSAGPAAAVQAISRSQSDSAGSSLPVDHENDDDDDDDMIKEEEEDESEVEGVTNSLGILKVDAEQGKSLYVGDSHWHLVLADVRIPLLPLSIYGYFWTCGQRCNHLFVWVWLGWITRMYARRTGDCLPLRIVCSALLQRNMWLTNRSSRSQR